MTNCHQLKIKAADGKKYLTDAADPETLLRLIQSVPNPKAEPIKLWLAKTGYERMQNMADPARSLGRAREYWQQHGRRKTNGGRFFVSHRNIGIKKEFKKREYCPDPVEALGFIAAINERYN
ncbi:MAG: hypothetical protein P9M03_08960 [Candidatus Theseobacter exili]|nr:hypothetical protein [Candidatus Theseobacter exili]